MTMQPKAKKFRTKRASPTNATAHPDAKEHASAQETAAASKADAETDNQKDCAGQQVSEIDAIRKEGLTGRQLRMARRIAQKNGLSSNSGFEAVSLLRQRGIDPFERSNMLELIITPNEGHPTQRGTEPGEEGKKRLPQPVPTTEISPIEQRNREISSIQKDISRRRRSKLQMLATRLSLFVFMPAVLAGYYFFNIATPMFATKSEFLILQADTQAGSGIGGLLTGTQFATSQDSIAVQSYLQSKDAMIRLDADVGFKSHFTQDDIDPIQRLGAAPTNESAYAVYKKKVKVGYDPTEGVLRMEVIAADPESSRRFSEALIQYAEERVNNLSEQKRGDQLADARSSFERAEKDRREAQEALVQLQLAGATLDPQAVIASLRAQINNVEIQILEKELQLAALMDNLRPNQSRVDGALGDIRRLNKQLAELNARMTDASQGKNSLAQLSVRIQMAQADLATRDMLFQSALQQTEQTRMEANRQVRYLTTSVKPVAPEEASYPRSFENTVLAFLIFSGVYLMVSLTASILREQVTS